MKFWAGVIIGAIFASSVLFVLRLILELLGVDL